MAKKQQKKRKAKPRRKTGFARVSKAVMKQLEAPAPARRTRVCTRRCRRSASTKQRCGCVCGGARHGTEFLSDQQDLLALID